jgi:hypothetical protein
MTSALAAPRLTLEPISSSMDDDGIIKTMVELRGEQATTLLALAAKYPGAALKLNLHGLDDPALSDAERQLVDDLLRLGIASHVQLTDGSKWRIRLTQ